MKKLVSVLMCFAIICTVFAGCSSNEPKKSEADTTVSQVKFTVDNHYADIGESSINAYEKLCSAVINYETEVKFNMGLIDDVNQLFYTSFPLYPLVDRVSYNDDKTGVILSYVYSEEEHTAKIEEFNKSVNQIMNDCGYGSVGKNAYLINLYSYICQNVTLDTSVTTVYDTIITKKGMNATISGMFEYLLLQADISASHLMNIDTDSIAKMMTMAEFNGQMYYFDPASEIEKTVGKGLTCFAMNDKRAGISKSNKFVFTDSASPDKIEDKTFDKLKKSTAYTINGSKVTVALEKNSEFLFELL